MTPSGPLEAKVLAKLKAAFDPLYMELFNESSMHNVPPGSESHFKLVLVSAQFEGLSRIARQREVYRVLEAELKGGIHALSQRSFSPIEWQKVADVHVMTSPPCHGGDGKKED
jgi:BolA protein